MTHTSSTLYRIAVYNGQARPAKHPYRIETVESERVARRVAAQMLGHRTLRGAASWERSQGGTVWRFGPRAPEHNGYDFVVIEAYQKILDTDDCS